MPTDVSVFTLTDIEKTLGADKLAEMLSHFSCPINSDIEDYLKNPDRATNSSHMSTSVTYLALNSGTGELLGYFTLMMKAYSIVEDQLSSKNRNLVKRFSQVDGSGKFVAPVYLIAQLGKNFAIPKERQIAGRELLRIALGLFRGTKKVLGGKLVMVEREINRPKLMAFYNKNGFKSWTRRFDEKSEVEFDQMFAVLNDEPAGGS